MANFFAPSEATVNIEGVPSSGEVKTKNTFLEFGQSARTPSMEQFAINKYASAPAADQSSLLAQLARELSGQIRLDSVMEDVEESSSHSPVAFNPVVPNDDDLPLFNQQAHDTAMVTNAFSMLLTEMAMTNAKQQVQPAPAPLLPAPQLAGHVVTPETEPEEQTTVMLRNIPNKYTQSTLLEALDSRGFKARYNFFYLPIDFKNGCNMGYAFINFNTNTDACEFMTLFKGYQLPAVKSVKVCDVCWARVQLWCCKGLSRNVEHYRNSPVNDLPDPQYRPLLFDSATGAELPFPRPDSSSRKNPTKKLGLQERPERQAGAMSGNGNGLIAAPRAQEPEKKNRIFVGGLGNDTTDRDILQYFAQFGLVTEAQVVKDRRSGASRGFGFCTFESEAIAEQVLSSNRHWINGQSVGIRLYSANK